MIAIIFDIDGTLAIQVNITQVATYIANALVGGVSNPDLEKKA